MEKKEFKKEDSPINNIKSTENSASIGHIDQIRDILFGEQIKTIQNQIEQFNTEIQQSFNAFSHENKEQIDLLNEKINTEIDKINAQLEKKQSDFDETISNIKKNFSDQINNMSIEMHKMNEDVMLNLKKEINILHGDKVHKKQLAKLFSEISKQLINDESSSEHVGNE